MDPGQREATAVETGRRRLDICMVATSTMGQPGAELYCTPRGCGQHISRRHRDAVECGMPGDGRIDHGPIGRDQNIDGHEGSVAAQGGVAELPPPPTRCGNGGGGTRSVNE
jgi:hypothetical protein